MCTLVKYRIFQIFVCIDHMAKKGWKCCPNNFPIPILGCPYTPNVHNKTDNGRLYRIRGQSLNSCLFRPRTCSSSGIALCHGLATLPGAWITGVSSSVGRDVSIFSIFSFKAVAFKDFWPFQRIAYWGSHSRILLLCEVIDSTRVFVMETETKLCYETEAAYCWGNSSF